MKKSVLIIVATVMGAVCVALLLWPHDHRGASTQVAPKARPAVALRIGINPERDIYQQRRAYRMLGDYLQSKGTGEVELLTASSYGGTLKDLEEGTADVAFVGSLVAVLAHDRCGAEVVLKSEIPAGESTYAGVLIVPAGSAVKTFGDLRGKRIGGVKTTTAGAVYPLYLIRQLGWAATDVPSLVWSGTHDDVLAEVSAGTLDAGAVKDSRYVAYVAAHPETRLKKISESGRVPNNALIVRNDLPVAKKEQVVRVLEGMDQDTAAAPVLAALQLKRFVHSDITEYGPLYDMIEAIGPGWFAMDIGPAPRRPAAGRGL